MSLFRHFQRASIHPQTNSAPQDRPEDRLNHHPMCECKTNFMIKSLSMMSGYYDLRVVDCRWRCRD
jgi:hypothetical protein